MANRTPIRALDATAQGLALLTCFALSAQNAFAYLDPVSTTFILQAIAGFVAAAIAGVRSFRKRVFTFLRTGKFVDPERASPRAVDATDGDGRNRTQGADARFPARGTRRPND